VIARFVAALAIALVAGTTCLAQFEVQNADNPPFDPERLIRDVFLGEGVEVVNIQFDGPTTAIGYFKGGAAAVGIDEGIAITTGLAKSSSSGAGIDRPSEIDAQVANGSAVTDDNLTSIVPNDPDGSTNLFDISRYTITFIPKGDRVRFRYVFGSEEYPEFVCSQYNDIFGFFLDGPGLSGPFERSGVNLATVPGTNLPVTINSINPGMHGTQGSPTGCDGAGGSLTQTAFYSDNTAPGNFPTYDGLTTLLTVEADVMPCSTYTMQITIGDVGDGNYDSGVFLQAKSFSTPTLDVELATASLAGEVAEGCEPGDLIFRVSEPSMVDQTFPYTVGGTATMGADFDPLPGSITIPAGVLEVRTPIFATVDGIAEGTETIEVTVQVDPCTQRTVEMKLVDRSIPPVPLTVDTVICAGESVPLDATVPAAVDPPLTFENNDVAFIGIPNTPTFRDIEVSGISPIALQGGLVVSVCVNIMHDRTEDLDLYLYSPDGKYLELSTDNGGRTAGGYGNVCFSSDATQAVNDPAASTPLSGTYLPEGDWSALWDGSATGADGTWRLQIVDDENGSNGFYTNWNITFAPVYNVEYAWTPVAGLSCTDCPDPIATPNATTTYTVMAWDSYGCTETADARITILDALADPGLSCSPAFDEIVWTWSSDADVQRYEISEDNVTWTDVGKDTSYTISGLGFMEDRTLYLRAISECEVFASNSTCTTQNCTSYPLTATPVDASCSGYDDGSVSITAGGGVPPHTFTLDGVSNSTGVFADLLAGSYTASVVDANNCGGAVTFTVGEPAAIATSTTFVAPSNCGDPFQVSVNAAGGAGAPYSYMWDNGDATASSMYPDAGIYFVDVTDAAGCVATDSVAIPQTPELALDATSTDIECFGESTGAITVSGSDGAGSYEYALDGVFGSNSTFNNLSAGSYSVSVRDAIGCIKDTAIILVESPELSIEFDIQDADCNGANNGAIDATISGGTPPYSYSWSNGSSTEDLSDLPSGTYELTVTDAASCSLSQSATVAQPGTLTLNLEPQHLDCNGDNDGQIQARVSGGLKPYVFTWSTGLVTSDSLLTDLVAGTYSLTVTDAGGCSVGNMTTLVEPELLEASHNAQPVTCAGTATGSINLILTGGTAPYSYLWSDGNTDEDRSDLPAGNYSVDVSDAQGCMINYSIILDEAPPLVVMFDVTDVSCFGESDGRIDLTTTGGQAPYTYEWTGPNGYAFFDSSPTGLVAGEYTLAFIDSYGCPYDAVITVREPSAMGLTTQARDSICFGATQGEAWVTVSGGTAPFSYNWSNGETGDTARALTAGTTTVEVIDANLCAQTADVEVFQLQQLTAQLDQEGVACFNDSNGVARVIDLRYGNGSSRTPSDFALEWDGDPSETNETYTNLGGTQTVELVATDSRGCVATEQITIASPTQLRGSAETVADLSCFESDDGSARVSALGGTQAYTYRWLSPTATPSAQVVEDLVAGRHEVEIIDANGCLDTASVTLLQPDSLQLAMESTAVNCFSRTSGTATVDVLGGTAPYNYTWQDGQRTRTATELRADDYSVVVTDDNGCQNMRSITVEAASQVELEGSHEDVTCNGQRNGAISLSSSGGEAPYSYSIRGISFTSQPNFRFLPAGEYYALAQDRHGCPSDSMYFDILEPDPLMVFVQDEVSVELGDTISLTAEVENGMGSLDYLWLPGGSAELNCNDCAQVVARPLQQGILKLQVIDERGCEGEASTRIRVTKTSQVAVPTGFTPNGDGIDDRLLVHGKTGTRVNRFRVYDRWGNVVHTSFRYSVNDPNSGWDGTVGALPASGGLYIWELEVQYLDGISETLTGQTTLIK